MDNSDLKEIADDICAVANLKFTESTTNFDYRWILVEEKENGKSMKLEPQKQVEYTIISAIRSLENYPSYIRFKEYVEGIDSIQNVVSMGGIYYWPDQLFTQLMMAAFSQLDQCFNSTHLLNELERLLAMISGGFHNIILTARLHGVKLESDSIEIETGISLVRLDKQAINERQPLITRSSFSPAILDYSDSNVEIIIQEKYEISLGHRANWREELELKLENIVKAVKLHRHGNFQVYPEVYHSSLAGELGQFSQCEPKVTRDKVLLSSSDRDDLRKSCAVVNIISQDSVLKRSFSRFLIGVDERIPEEQIVDFVIAWESILQTVNGASNKAELVYRFSLNGAAVLCAVDNAREFTQAQTLMKEIYNIRSAIVHGGDSEAIVKNLKKIDFDSLDSLNNKIAELYRKVIFWLSGLEKEERPYHKNFGWELLLRKQPNNSNEELLPI
jgi:Apea-like HEPN